MSRRRSTSLRLAAAALGLALSLPLALPAAAQEEDAGFVSVAECFAAGEPLGACIDLFLPAFPAAPTPDDEEAGEEDVTAAPPAPPVFERPENFPPGIDLPFVEDEEEDE